MEAATLGVENERCFFHFGAGAVSNGQTLAIRYRSRQRESTGGRLCNSDSIKSIRLSIALEIPSRETITARDRAVRAYANVDRDFLAIEIVVPVSPSFFFNALINRAHESEGIIGGDIG